MWYRELVKRNEDLLLPVGGAIVSVVPLSESVKIVNPLEISVGTSRERFPPEWISRSSRVLIALIRNVFRVELEIREPVRKPRRIKLSLLDSQGMKRNEIQLHYPQWIFPINQQ